MGRDFVEEESGKGLISMTIKIINLFDLEKLLEKNLPKPIFEYYQSAARDEITLKKNREIFNKYELLPKLLRDVSNINTSVEILGLKLRNPIILGPVAMQQMAHEDGELASAAAAEKFGSGMTLSTSSNYSIDEVSTHNQNLFFQLDFAKDRSITEAMLKRTKEFGFKAIVFTADAPKLGTRENDERNKSKRSEIRVKDFEETKMLNFFNLGGIRFQNIASNDAIISSKINTLAARGWELAFVTSGVESFAGKGDSNGIFVTRYILKRKVGTSEE